MPSIESVPGMQSAESGITITINNRQHASANTERLGTYIGSYVESEVFHFTQFSISSPCGGGGGLSNPKRDALTLT